MIPPDFPNEALETLRCPICLEVAVPPIQMCKTGHFVCAICRKKINKCAICRRTLTDARNFALENLVSLLTFKCRNQPCAQSVKPENMAKHVLYTCEYR